ncbi:hypothetical protein BDQ17DRAFT_1428822 [Cyathus striatus]|nr:hypothetical protein BDQ17DRAFT_1428822 [Cyathus striatus]
MSHCCSPFPNPRSFPGSELKLDDTFETAQKDVYHNHHEQTPLTNIFHLQSSSSTVASSAESSAIPCAYYSERDDECPPSGSGHSPSGQHVPSELRISSFGKAVSPVGAILPSYYTRSQQQVPPPYLEAEADTLPPYTGHFSPENDDEYFIAGLPSGSIAMFIFSIFASYVQFIGFLFRLLYAVLHSLL